MDSTAEPEGNPEIELAAAERLTFFSDAVVAIAITLLALELPLPTGTTNSAFVHSLGTHGDSYLAFLISFVVIGAHWRGHHQVFRYVRQLGGRIQRLNFLWLLMIVVTPFTTRVLTGDGAFFVRFTLYAAVQALASLLFLLMLREMDRHQLLLGDAPPALLPRGYRRGGTIAATFAVSIPVALLGQGSFVLWIAVPLLVRTLRLLADARRRRPRRAQGGD